MVRKTLRHYDQVFWARTEEEIDLDDVPTEKIRRMHIGKRTLVAAAGQPKDPRGLPYLRRHLRDIKSYLGNDSTKYSFEIREIKHPYIKGKNEYGLIITKLEKLNPKRKSLEARI